MKPYDAKETPNVTPTQYRNTGNTTRNESMLSIRCLRAVLPLLAALLFCAPTAPQVFSQSFVLASPEEAGVSSERLARIDAVLEAYVEEERLPGSALVIGRRGHVVYARAFGYRDREAEEPLEDYGPFPHRFADQGGHFGGRDGIAGARALADRSGPE